MKQKVSFIKPFLLVLIFSFNSLFSNFTVQDLYLTAYRKFSQTSGFMDLLQKERDARKLELIWTLYYQNKQEEALRLVSFFAQRRKYTLFKDLKDDFGLLETLCRQNNCWDPIQVSDLWKNNNGGAFEILSALWLEKEGYEIEAFGVEFNYSSSSLIDLPGNGEFMLKTTEYDIVAKKFCPEEDCIKKIVLEAKSCRKLGGTKQVNQLIKERNNIELAQLLYKDYLDNNLHYKVFRAHRGKAILVLSGPSSGNVDISIICNSVYNNSTNAKNILDSTMQKIKLISECSLNSIYRVSILDYINFKARLDRLGIPYFDDIETRCQDYEVDLATNQLSMTSI